eukprot:CAMPEP_0179474272 /NCGR_PEP_ID=MMETSP0799-20121207/53776_1 /TAXON_ID=46947 /ORGANISM="Geminigera cryophila, Strain CCMP2564" /LENGTH=47 /DNA_ID= /DNA_START= /DNA_END= /DNA_ORIENTATION=
MARYVGGHLASKQCAGRLKSCAFTLSGSVLNQVQNALKLSSRSPPAT